MFFKVLKFEKHRQGTGTDHYAASDGNWTFEHIPASANFPRSASVRVGLAMDSCDEVGGRLRGAGFSIEVPTTDSLLGRRAVALDPDGYRVELTPALNRSRVFGVDRLHPKLKGAKCRMLQTENEAQRTQNKVIDSSANPHGASF